MKEHLLHNCSHIVLFRKIIIYKHLILQILDCNTFKLLRIEMRKISKGPDRRAEHSKKKAPIGFLYRISHSQSRAAVGPQMQTKMCT